MAQIILFSHFRFKPETSADACNYWHRINVFKCFSDRHCINYCVNAVILPCYANGKKVFCVVHFNRLAELEWHFEDKHIIVIIV